MNQHTDWGGYLLSMLEAIRQFDVIQMDTIYNQIFTEFPLQMVATHFLLPLLHQLTSNSEALESEQVEKSCYAVPLSLNRRSISERLISLPGKSAEASLFYTYLYNKLGARFQHTNLKATGTQLLFASVTASKDELTLLLFALYVVEHGYRVIYLSGYTPLSEIMYVLDKIDCQGVVLAGKLSEEHYMQLNQTYIRIAIPIFLKTENNAPAHLTSDNITLLSEDFSKALQVIESKVSERA